MGEADARERGQRDGSCLVLEQLAGHVGAAQRRLGFVAPGLADEGFDHPVPSHGEDASASSPPAWVRRRGQARGHHRGLGSVMTVLMASRQITRVKPDAMQGSQLILHGLSASRIRPQTSQQEARVSSIPHTALCPRLVAARQDAPCSSTCRTLPKRYGGVPLPPLQPDFPLSLSP